MMLLVKLIALLLVVSYSSLGKLTVWNLLTLIIDYNLCFNIDHAIAQGNAIRQT